MNKSGKKIVGIFTYSVLFLMCMSVIYSGAVQIARDIDEHKEAGEWKASEYYPLEKAEYSVRHSVLNKIAAIENKIEEEATSSFDFKMPFVLTKKACDRVLGLDMTTSLCSGDNDLNKVDDIVLAYEEDYLGFVMDDVDIAGKIENLVSFGSQMKGEGRNFLLFMTPDKFKGNEIYQNYSEEKKEEVRNSFLEKNLDIVCISEMMDKNNMISLFFKTDHHWKPSAGIWADRLLCEFLNKNYGYHFDTSVFDMGNYEIEIREESFLGSQGKKVTEVYSSKEDFPIILPQYNTDLDVFISGKGKICYGSIEDTLLDYSVFEEKSSYLRKNYSFYGYGDQALITIHNNNVHDGSNILMIKTSFAHCMYPYLAAAVEDLSIVDLRYFDGSIQSYIKEIEPDTIIVIYGMAAFEGGNDLFDFR
ncbi:MAG: DHHW family protein [Blautia sp.]|nr:DHHW family protein [Blautia sp.]MCM1202158.1 DHHW family protein [Bacteroides fragilis]